jgi:hypothetical protein
VFVGVAAKSKLSLKKTNNNNNNNNNIEEEDEIDFTFTVRCPEKNPATEPCPLCSRYLLMSLDQLDQH